VSNCSPVRGCARRLTVSAVVFALVLLAGLPPALAQGQAGRGLTWSQLSPVQREALAPLSSKWDSLGDVQQQKWVVLASRLPGMSNADRDRVRARMAEWARMTPAERGRARQNLPETRLAAGPDRQALWEAYNALPPEQRDELAQRANPAAKRAAAKAPGTATSAAAPVVKSNLVKVPRPADAPSPRVTPTIVQAKPGATTTLMTSRSPPPSHSQPGLPKIVASEGFVNPATLLPRRGLQGAAATPPLASASAVQRAR